MHALLLLASVASANSAFNLAHAVFHAKDISNANHQARRETPEDDFADYSAPYGLYVTVTDVDCATALAELDTSLPTPPPGLIEHIDEDFCYTDVPEDLSSASSSFTSEWASWTSANGDQIESAKSECPDLTKEIDLVMNMCKETSVIEAYHEDAAPQNSVVLMGAALAAIGAVVVGL
ncbi:hypothetical protein CC79DRAFT_1335153 [Sarocladium strictum]